jgi:hypothetical protein
MLICLYSKTENLAQGLSGASAIGMPKTEGESAALRAPLASSISGFMFQGETLKLLSASR